MPNTGFKTESVILVKRKKPNARCVVNLTKQIDMIEFYDDWDLLWHELKKKAISPKLLIVYNAMTISANVIKHSYFFSRIKSAITNRWTVKYRVKAVVTHDRVLTNSMR